MGRPRSDYAAADWGVLRLIESRQSHCQRCLNMQAIGLKRLANGKAAVFTTILFLLIFTGPPKFRVREVDASLSGELDFALIVQVIVWLIAGAWVARQLWLSYKGRRPPIRFKFAHVLALSLMALLTVSARKSLAPELTLFKVFQLSVDFLFCLIFIEWYGVERFLDVMLSGYLLLCAMIGVCALFIPEFVFAESETGALRLEGRLITEAGTAAAFALMLLLGARRKVTAFWFWFSLCGFILVASLTRNAWAAVAAFAVLALWKRPRLPRIGLIYVLCGAMAATALIGGFAELDHYRDPANVYTLSDRFGLWAFLSESVMSRSPALGFGYVAGTRTLGPEYNPDLGSGHSIFFEVFVGGGLVSLGVFLLLLATLGIQALRAMTTHGRAADFTVCALFFAAVLMGTVGGELDSTPYAFTFWGVAAALPLLGERLSAPATSQSHTLAITPSPVRS